MFRHIEKRVSVPEEIIKSILHFIAPEMTENAGKHVLLILLVSGPLHLSNLLLTCHLNVVLKHAVLFLR